MNNLGDTNDERLETSLYVTMLAVAIETSLELHSCHYGDPRRFWCCKSYARNPFFIIKREAGCSSLL